MDGAVAAYALVYGRTYLRNADIKEIFMENGFKFWDKNITLYEDDIDIYNVIMQFDFGDGNREYSPEEIKSLGMDYSAVTAGLKYIICVYREEDREYLAFVDIEDGAIGYTFIRKGEEEACECEGQDIVAANIFGIADDTLLEICEK